MQNILKKVLEKYNIKYSEKEIDNMCKFVEMMKKYNETTNITAIIDDNDIVYKHLLDSILPIDMFDENQKILDIGCGAGFPSVPLAIMNNSLNITAIDSVRKKTDFVESVKNALNLDNLNIKHTRIEDFAIKKGCRESFDIVLSRAVAPLNIIIEYSAPMLINGGYIIAYKGSNYKEELKSAENALKVLDCELVEEIPYHIDELEATRCILKIRKKSNVSDKYPRKQNKPRLQPL